jgi:hypothetical protein
VISATRHLAPDDELHPEWRPWVERFVAARGFHFNQLERGELWGHDRFPFSSLDELLLYFILSDPVHFAECCFTERDADEQGPWRLWDYQKVSIRYRGSVIHEDGSEVGKTREIVALVVWHLLTQRGDQLVAGALDIHSDAIWKEVEWQLHANPWLEAQVDWANTKKKPYVELVAVNGNRVFFRPAGVDGRALRSTHCRRAIYMDEACKVKNPEIWGNFFSRAKPEAEIRVYSTPDGDRSTRYFDLAQRAPAVEPDGSNLEQIAAAATVLEGSDLKARRFIRFRWPKSLMPRKFYNEALLAEWEERYGGRESSEYQHNVLGNWGDPQAAVFPWAQFARCLRYIPEYACVRLSWDDAKGSGTVSAHRLRPGYQVAGPAGDEDTEALEAASPLIALANHRHTPAEELQDVAAVETLLREFLRPVPGALVAGIDPGTTTDPCEILIYLALDPVLRCVARVELRQFTDPRKRLVLYALQRLYTPSQGWGLDATGAGAPLQHELVAGSEDPDSAWQFDVGLSGFVFNAFTVDLSPETGEPATDPSTGKERRVSYLEQGVGLVKGLVQRRYLELPYDPDFGLQFPGYTERIGASGRPTYRHNRNDHLVAATVAARLRHFHLRFGSLNAPPVTFASLGRGREPVDGAPSRRPGSAARGSGHPLDDLLGGGPTRPFAAGGPSAAAALREW